MPRFPKPGPGGRSRAGMVLAAGVLAALSPLFAALWGRLLSGTDILLYYYPLRDFINNQVLSGAAPLWFPYSFMGLPLAANPQSALFYPVDWISLLLPLNVFFSMTVLIHALICAFGTWFLARELGISRRGSLLAAWAFTLSMAMASRISVGHLGVTHTMAYVPLILFFLERLLVRRRLVWALPCGLILGLQILAGEPQINYYTVISMAAYAALRPSGLGMLGRGAGLALAGLVGACVGLVQILPALEFVSWSNRAAASSEFVGFLSLRWSSLLSALFPRWSVTYQGGSEFFLNLLTSNWENQWYIGIAPLVLGLSALVRLRDRRVWSLACVAAVFLVLALAGSLPGGGSLSRFVPGFSLFRIHARAALFSMLILCLLAGMGFDGFFGLEQARSRVCAWARWVSASALALFFVLSAVVIQYGNMIIFFIKGLSESYTYLTLEQVGGLWRSPYFWIPLAGVVGAFIAFRLPQRWGRGAAAFVLTVTLIELAALSFVTIKMKTPEQMSYPMAVRTIRAFGIEEIEGRLWAPRWVVPGAETALLEVRNVDGYMPVAPARAFDLLHEALGVEPDPLYRESLNARPWSDQPTFPFPFIDHTVTVVQRSDTVELELAVNARPGPRAAAVYDFSWAETADESMDGVLAADFDAWTQAWYEGAHVAAGRDPTQTPAGRAVVEEDAPGRAELRVWCETDCLVVFTESFDPGWRAYIDGEPAPTVIANHAFIGVFAPGGDSRVRFVYAPRWFPWAGVFSALAFAGFLAAFLVLGRGPDQTGPGIQGRDFASEPGCCYDGGDGPNP